MKSYHRLFKIIPLLLLAGLWIVGQSSFLTYPQPEPQAPGASPGPSLEITEAPPQVIYNTTAEKGADAAEGLDAAQLQRWNPGLLRGADEVAVVLHVARRGRLPDSYLTKRQAQEAGWVASEGNLRDVAPGQTIGGDRFYNREGNLPHAPGRTWYEADLNYRGGSRGPERLVFSSDGLIYITRDHYETFQQVRITP